jgi:hypothetical protein
MSDSGSSPEVTAIESAYDAQIQILFQTLCTGLIEGPVTHQTDQPSLDRFKLGLQTAQRAKKLALNIVATLDAPPATS